MGRELSKELLILFGVTCLSSIGLFARKWLFAYDSYAWLSFTSGIIPSFGWHPGADFVFGFVPPSQLAFNIIMFACFFVSLCGLYFGLKKVLGKTSAFTSTLILLAGAPIMIYSFAQFQNETLAYPLIFWSFYFLMAKKPKISVVLSVLAIPFWSGAVIWLGIIGFGLVYEYLFVFLGISVLGLWLKPALFNLGSFLGNSNGEVMYGTWFYGLIDFFLLFPLIFSIFLGKDKRLIAWSIAALVAVIFSARFTILLLPFIGIGLANMLPMLIKWLGSKKLLIGMCFLLIITWNIALYMQHPTEKEMVGVSHFVESCKTHTCYNDWSMGWWITALGGETQSKAGPPSPDFNELVRPFDALTIQSLDCQLLYVEGNINYYRCI